jgi:hypothetical protein
MKPVIAQFILNPQQNQDAACNADCQARDVDERIDPITFKVPKSDFHIIFEHLETPID